MISVIIPAKDAAKTIGACLQAVLDQEDLDLPFEVIVVDDASADDTKEIAAGFDVRILSAEGRGPAAARNAGAAASSGDILAFTDADCEPVPRWLSELKRPLSNGQVVGVKGAYRTRQGGWAPRFVQQEYAYKYKRMARLTTIDFIDTHSAAYRKDVYLANGGFEEAFPVPSVEDQELSFRLARKGYGMVFAPNAIVYHQHDRNVWEYMIRKLRIGYWKAYLLHWLPEKAMGDSHTPGTQRAQIVLLGLSFVCSLLGLVWPSAYFLALLSLILFYLSALPFFSHLARQDPKLLLLAPLMIVVRAAALGAGLLAGFLFPQVELPAGEAGFSIGTRALKRLLDIVGSSIGMILSAPLIAVAAIAIKLDSPGSVFFVQERAGEHGKPFRMYKLRTMVRDAEARIGQVLKTNPLEGPVYKIPNDPRVTRVGRILRRWSMDEIPQLWNVLRGEMSLVGPRPEETWIVARYDDRQRSRLAVKPGLTGPMQVGGRGDLDMEDRLRLEIEYIRNYSIWKDLGILWRSVPVVLTGKGAY
jgi:lipopolysaccharide/colanic/teichoic acid biosynthesis glycosyltransferase/glycosyltransferase involved in cell wall biosynthesis